MIIPESYLAHHGILGQKWGVRRYQNSDGSLTAAGRKRYNVGDSKSAKESVAGNVGETVGSTKNTTKNANSKSNSITKAHKTLAQIRKDREKAKIAKAKHEEALKREALKQQEIERQAKIKAEEEADKEAFEAKKTAILKSDNPLLILQNSQMFSTQELSAASERIRVLNALQQNVPKEEAPLTKFDEKMKKLNNASTAIDSIGRLTDSINNAAPKAVKAYNTFADILGVASGGGIMLQKITAFDKKLNQNELLDLKLKEANTMKAQYQAKLEKFNYEQKVEKAQKSSGSTEQAKQKAQKSSGSTEQAKQKTQKASGPSEQANQKSQKASGPSEQAKQKSQKSSGPSEQAKQKSQKSSGSTERAKLSFLSAPAEQSKREYREERGPISLPGPTEQVKREDRGPIMLPGPTEQVKREDRGPIMLPGPTEQVKREEQGPILLPGPTEQDKRKDRKK